MRVLPIAAGATFLAMLDATIANLAIADLGRDFAAASIGDLSWVISAYAVAFAGLLAGAGRLAAVVGLRALFVAGVGLFTLMSAACAAASSLGLLAGARALQGAGAAAMIPASLAVLLVAVPAARRSAAVGAWAASSALAAAAGPAVGGVLVDAFGWRAVFVVNVPLGAWLALAAWRTLPAPATNGVRPPLPDLLGTALLAAGIGAVVAGLTEGGGWGWGSPATLLAVGGGAALVAAALARSARRPVPAVEIGLWRARRFAVANVASLLYGASLFPWLLLGVLVLTRLWGYSELEAGLAMTPAAIVAALAAVAGGRVAERVGPGPLVAAGGLVLAASALWVAVALEPRDQLWSLWLPAGVAIGIGTGLLATGTSTAAALAVAPARFADATGLNTTARQVGGALGVAVLALLMPAAPALGDFTAVYAFCGAAAFAAGVAGLALIRPAAAPVAAGTVPEGSR
ncbi:MAG: MFS transporter [Solirubrobacteraceae bacterium]|nr:MFS transporter [Solirubrobacteraceae bacterium]